MDRGHRPRHPPQPQPPNPEPLETTSLIVPDSWWVYVVETASGALYTGISTDPERRLAEHAGGRRGAKFFRTSPPARVVFRESWPTRAEAASRERAIKAMPRAGKLALVRDGGPGG